MKYLMKGYCKEWEEVDEEMFFNHLKNEIMIAPDYDIIASLKRSAIVGTKHLFKITETIT